MEGFVERSLVVDASFSSRRQLLQELRDAHVAREIIEAPSVREAIVTVENSALGACFIGPTLSEVVAVDFVRRGIEVSKSPDCAFVAIVGEGRSAEPLIKAGAHATLQIPIVPAAFTEMVRKAVTLASEHAAKREQLKASRQTVVALPQILNDLAAGLEDVAADLARGRFSLRQDGQPSLATRDALRLVIEKAITTQEQNIQIGTFDHYFITKVVEWFVDRITADQNASVNRLRRKLVSYRPTA